MRALRSVAAFGAATVAFVVLSVATSVALASPASAKSFEIVAVEVDAVLAPDASMRVVERITYDFDGEFHNGTRFIPPGRYQITDVSVTDHETGEALLFGGAPHRLAWHYDAVDERRTFDIAYTVIGAATVGPDVAELYWQFVGNEHPGVGQVRVQVDVPGDGVDVLAWAHGPLHGTVEPRGASVFLSVDGVPANEFVEGRIVVPATAFSVPPTGDGRLGRIIAEEQRWADEANALRARDLEAERRREQIRDVLRVTYWIPAALGAFLFGWLFLRYGREHAIPDTEPVGEYVREPPDDPPAFVSMLRKWGSVEPTVLSATIVDLAQRGHLTIEEIRKDRWILPDKVDWRFTWKQSADTVYPFERRILDRLFAGSTTTTQQEFTTWCKQHRTTASRWWDDVKSDLREEFRRRDYIEGGRGIVMFGYALAAVAVGAVGVLAVSLGVYVGAFAIAAAVLLLLLTPLLRRRTPLGRRRVEEWESFERFLRDFSELEEAPVGHLILWERYLVYAVALGVTAQVARALAARIPAEEAGFATWYTGPHGGVGALHSIGSFSDFSSGFGRSVVSAAVPQSSGSGGGGGFSGGGGGGGGGGSIGAS